LFILSCSFLPTTPQNERLTTKIIHTLAFGDALIDVSTQNLANDKKHSKLLNRQKKNEKIAQVVNIQKTTKHP